MYGYPVALAAPLAVATVRAATTEFGGLEEVIFCCFSARDLAVYEGLLGQEPGPTG